MYSFVKLLGGQKSVASFVVHRLCTLCFRSPSVLRASSPVSFSLFLLPHICFLPLILTPASSDALRLYIIQDRLQLEMLYLATSVDSFSLSIKSCVGFGYWELAAFVVGVGHCWPAALG